MKKLLFVLLLLAAVQAAAQSHHICADDSDCRNSKRGFGDGIAPEPAERLCRRSAVESLGRMRKPRRQAQAIHCRQRDHGAEERELHEQQPAVAGPEQSRHALYRIPGVGDAGQQQGPNARHAEKGEAPSDTRRKVERVGASIARQAEGEDERRKRTEPGPGGEEMRRIR